MIAIPVKGRRALDSELVAGDASHQGAVAILFHVSL
jgi:hypothetical protein